MSLLCLNKVVDTHVFILLLLTHTNILQVRQMLGRPPLSDEWEGVARVDEEAIDGQAKAEPRQPRAARRPAERQDAKGVAKAATVDQLQGQRQQQQQWQLEERLRQQNDTNDLSRAEGKASAAADNCATADAGATAPAVGKASPAATPPANASAGVKRSDIRTAEPSRARAGVAKANAQCVWPAKFATDTPTKACVYAEETTGGIFWSNSNAGAWLWPDAVARTTAATNKSGGNVNDNPRGRAHSGGDSGGAVGGAREVVGGGMPELPRAAGAAGAAEAAAAVRPPPLGRLMWIIRATAPDSFPLGHWKTYRKPAKWEKTVTTAVTR